MEPLLVADLFFRRFRDRGHHFHRLLRVFSGGGLAREHNGGGTVVYGVGDVGDFRAGRAGRVYHRFEHFRGGNDPFAEPAALFNEFLLHGGQPFGRDFDAHIAAADHNAGTLLKDLLEIVDTGLILNFGDEFDIGRAVLRHELLDFFQVVRLRDKGARDEFDVVLDSEQNIFPILIAQIFRVHDLAGEVHTLAVGQLAVGERFAEHVVSVDLHNEKVHESVGDQNVIARLDVAREPLEAHGDALFIADYVFGVERELIARLQRDLSVGERFNSELRAFRIEQNGDGNLEPFAHFLNDLDAAQMVVVRSVREIEPCDVHTGAAQLFNHFRTFACRPDSAYDLSLSHGLVPPFLCLNGRSVVSLHSAREASVVRGLLNDTTKFKYREERR